MADDKTVIELIVQGAQQAVRQILSVSQSQTDLARVQEQAVQSQVRSYDLVSQAAAKAAEAQVQAAKRAQEAQVEAAKAVAGSSGAGRNPTTGRFISQAQAQAIAQQASARATPQIANLGGLSQRIAAATQPPAPAVNPQTTQNVQQQVAALRQLATTAQQAAAAQNVLTQQGQRTAASLLATAAAANRQANALAGVVNASSKATSGGITYLSVLSAIHAASFLSTNRTFSMVGSFLTLGLAFSKVGIAATGIGLVLGGLLAIFGQVSQAIQTIQQATINGAVGLAAFAGAATGLAVAAGGASVKLAANVETQLAAVRAFGGATTEQLKIVAAQAEELGAKFGVATADVVEATSLFARAGGTVQEAIDGATEAIIRLQVASQGELSAAQAAIVLSAALKQFGLAGDQAVRVADNLTAAAQGSALSFAGVQQAFIQAAPGAAALGITIEDLSSAIALLGDQLVKGTTTGTAFKQFILDVVNPTKQAQAELAKYGITLKDTQGNALPFSVALEQLNKGLGDNAVAAGLVSKEQRATALAVAFGSRAFLAANILTAEGTAALQDFSDKLSQTTTSNIVDVLLLPLNKQLERLPVVAQQAGAAFGGPLLEPARQAVGQIIQFLGQIKPAVELVGQAVRTVLVGQGFEALQVAIAGLVGNNALTAFLIELVNSFRNVRDVIVSQIVPAVTTFLQTIGAIGGEPGRLDQLGTAFESINTKIQQVGAAAASAIVSFGLLIAEFVKGEGAGGRLRTVLEGLARTMLTQLAASTSTFVITLQAAVVAMPVFARVALLAAQAALTLAGAFKEVALKAIDIGTGLNQVGLAQGIAQAATAGNIELYNRLVDAYDRVGKGAEATKKGLAADADQALAVSKGIQDLLPQLDKLAGSFDTLGTGSAENARIARSSISDLVDEIVRTENINIELLTQDDLDKLISRASAMKQAASGAVNPFLQTFEDAQGRLGSIFDNITADIEQRGRDIAKATSTATPGAIGGLSQEELDKVKRRIDEAGRDISTRLKNLAEDSAQRVVNLIARSLERLDDIKQNAIQRIQEIQEAAEERIGEARRTTAERRQDRDAVDAERKKQEDQFTLFQRGLDRQSVSDQRALDDRQRLRQQDNEDFAKSTEQQFQDEETLQQRRISVVQRAFDIIQQARETAFDRAQQVEATAFQRSQQAAAEARQFTLSLANAKTPEEKAQLTKQRTQALQDTRFQQGQEDALTQFRQKQEDKKVEFSRQQETEQIGFRQGLEDRFTAFRRLQETNLQKFRRAEESKELGLRRQDEDAMLVLRLANEDTIQARRRQDALDLQQFQDAIDNQRQTEEEQRTRDKALKDIQKAIATAEKAQGEVIDKLFLDLAEQAAEVEKQIRNIIGVLIDLQDQVPPELFGQFASVLGAARQQAEGVQTALQAAQENAKLKVSGQTAVDSAELLLAQQRAAQALAVPAVGGGVTNRTPGQVLSLQTLQVASVILPATFSREVATAVQLGIQLAVERGLIPNELNVDLGPTTDVLNDIRRSLRG